MVIVFKNKVNEVSKKEKINLKVSWSPTTPGTSFWYIFLQTFSHLNIYIYIYVYLIFENILSILQLPAFFPT